MIAAKAVAFGEALQPSFKAYAQQVVANAQALAARIQERGIDVVSGGTDNHIVLLDLRGIGMTGKVADLLVSDVHITANKNTVPFDPQSPFVTSGLRLGTAACTTRGFDEVAFREVADVIADRLLNPEDSAIEQRCRDRVAALGEAGLPQGRAALIQRDGAEQLEQSEAIAKHWRSSMCDESTLGLPPTGRECRNW